MTTLKSDSDYVNAIEELYTGESHDIVTEIRMLALAKERFDLLTDDFNRFSPRLQQLIIQYYNFFRTNLY